MDRNALDHVSAPQIPMSLSARRAWIEIVGKLIYGNALGVALRKESVDRNQTLSGCCAVQAQSLSARRAWIEICVGLPPALTLLPSLSARRAWIEILTDIQ